MGASGVHFRSSPQYLPNNSLIGKGREGSSLLLTHVRRKVGDNPISSCQEKNKNNIKSRHYDTL